MYNDNETQADTRSPSHLHLLMSCSRLCWACHEESRQKMSQLFPKGPKFKVKKLKFSMCRFQPMRREYLEGC